MPGFDNALLDSIYVEQLFGRILFDVRSDFVYAPHYTAIYKHASQELWQKARELLSSGRYEPDLPLTIGVPKRGGFTRPGSILHPIDRVVYQMLADLTCDQLEGELDRERVFSNRVLRPDANNQMFESSGTSWRSYQQKLAELCEMHEWAIRGDIANYFERLPQHHLINLMAGSGCLAQAVNLLEELLMAFQQRNSFGIPQGLFPSDLFGNYYLACLDAYCDLHSLPSLRYVDDFFIFLDTEQQARLELSNVIDELRRDGLNLNEGKSRILPASRVIKDETDLDKLFTEAVQQVQKNRPSEPMSDGYGAAIVFGGEEQDDTGNETDDEAEGIHAGQRLEAVQQLFESTEDFPGDIDKIDKFCYPILRGLHSELGIERALSGITVRPQLSSVYLAYLRSFVNENADLSGQLQALLRTSEVLLPYQQMWIMMSLGTASSISSDCVNSALHFLESSSSEPVRAMAAIFAAKFGSAPQRRRVKMRYENETAYVKAAILYSTSFMSTRERATCKKAWGGHSLVNSLIAGKALKAG